jgi:hypothetical protein
MLVDLGASPPSSGACLRSPYLKRCMQARRCASKFWRAETATATLRVELNTLQVLKQLLLNPSSRSTTNMRSSSTSRFPHTTASTLQGGQMHTPYIALLQWRYAQS